jgi:hypothetical protein
MGTTHATAPVETTPVGGVPLGLLGSTSFPWSVLVLPIPVVVAVLAARVHGFPKHRTEQVG